MRSTVGEKDADIGVDISSKGGSDNVCQSGKSDWREMGVRSEKILSDTSE